MKKVWAKKDQEIRAKLGQRAKDPKVKSIFSSDAAFGVLTNDLLSIMQNVHSLGFSAQPIDDNIYFWSVKIFGFDPNSKIYSHLQEINKEFGYDYVEFQVLFTEDLYPFYPPTVKIIRPRLQGFLIGKVSHMEILALENWNPICDMRFVLNHLKEVLEKHGQLDVNNPMNSLKNNSGYSQLEHSLLRLEGLTHIPARANLKYGLPVTSIVKPAAMVNNIDDSTSSSPSSTGGNINSGGSTSTTSTSTFKAATTAGVKKTYWAKGTGYGNSSQKGWNVEAYLAAQKERDTEIKNLILYIESEIKSKPPPFDVLEESCLVPFLENYCRDVPLLDIDRHADLWNALFTLISSLVDNDLYVPLFSHLSYQSKPLGEFINDLSCQIQLVLKRLSEQERKALVLQTFIVSVENKLTEKLKKMKDEISSLEGSRTTSNVPAELNDTGVETKYIKTLKPWIFDSADLKSPKPTASSQQSRTLRIAQEQGSLMKSLPITFDSSVFVRVDENSIDTMKILITGPADTPYSAGCFLFNVTFPPQYPTNAPQVLLQTTGHGSVRFNPNLYNCGKVCLSLLGTWSGGSGETWNPNTSTLLQVLISIQSLILVPEPFFNEPGYESQIGTAQGKNSSMSYNQNIRIATIEWAMVDMIKNPPPYFKDVIHAHFYYQQQKIKKQCDKWLEECKSQNDSYLKLLKVVSKLYTELTALKPPNN
eukprot:gene1414-1783_t